MQRHILVIDQGTTSTRSIVFDATCRPVAAGQEEYRQIYPRPGWVEHDPEDIWATTLSTARAALRKAGVEASGLAGIGITNQRETAVIWDRRTGKPIHNAIVWQDRRTSGLCETLERQGHGATVAERTGLLLDPYFSATKIAWLLEHVPGARAAAEAGELAFGTIDSFLLFRLTNGRVHATDATNASRTLLFNIHTGAWDDDMLRLFGIPATLLPEVRDNAGRFGITAAEAIGAEVPVLGMAGDQHAALIGQCCFEPGMVKSTYGTGCFALLNTGARPVPSRHRLISTIAYQFDGSRSYALEGSIFVAGAAVQWLRDGLGLIGSAAEVGELAAQSDPDQPVYMVPAFVGLGAPHWDSEARALLAGITRGTTRKEIARAALEAVAYQTRDLLAAMRADLQHTDWGHADSGRTSGGHAASGYAASGHTDWSRTGPGSGGLGTGAAGTVIRVDGGMAVSDWTMQFLADMLGMPVDRPGCLETTAVGAAYLAGLAAGLYPEPAKFAAGWAAERRFTPAMPEQRRAAKYQGWQDALARALLRP